MELVSAFNSASPIYYNVLIRSRVSCTPFAHEDKKQYYVDLLKDNAGLPLSVVAYAIIGQDIRLVVAANDQAKPTVQQYCAWLDYTYFNEMYINIYPDTGAIFEKPVVKKLKKELALPCIAAVHNSAGLGNPFSSIYEYQGSGTKIVNTKLVLATLGDPLTCATAFPKKEWIPTKPVTKFKVLVKKIAAENGIKLKRYPLEVLPMVFYEVMGQTGCSFDEVGEIFRLTEEDRMKVIKDTIHFYWENDNKCYQIVNAFRLPDLNIFEYLLEYLEGKGYVPSVVRKNFEKGIM